MDDPPLNLQIGQCLGIVKRDVQEDLFPLGGYEISEINGKDIKIKIPPRYWKDINIGVGNGFECVFVLSALNFTSDKAFLIKSNNILNFYNNLAIFGDYHYQKNGFYLDNGRLNIIMDDTNVYYGFFISNFHRPFHVKNKSTVIIEPFIFISNNYYGIEAINYSTIIGQGVFNNIGDYGSSGSGVAIVCRNSKITFSGIAFNCYNTIITSDSELKIMIHINNYNTMMSNHNGISADNTIVQAGSSKIYNCRMAINATNGSKVFMLGYIDNCVSACSATSGSFIRVHDVFLTNCTSKYDPPANTLGNNNSYIQVS